MMNQFSIEKGQNLISKNVILCLVESIILCELMNRFCLFSTANCQPKSDRNRGYIQWISIEIIRLIEEPSKYVFFEISFPIHTIYTRNNNKMNLRHKQMPLDKTINNFMNVINYVLLKSMQHITADRKRQHIN